MALFNSLGSNYTPGFGLRSLLGLSQRSTKRLQYLLADHYEGRVTLTYKGREALELALRQSHLQPGSYVAINGFTCYAVYKAVVNAGFQALYVDVTKDSLNFSLKELQVAHQHRPELGAVIVQNTLGLSQDIAPLEEYCHQHELLLIEDLAHSLGMHYSDGREAGTVGNVAMLSFSQDKGVDVVAGGALIDRRSQISTHPDLPTIAWRQRIKNRWYPLLASLIRWTYPVGLGRYLHFALKKLHWLATPMSDDLEGLHAMTSKAIALLTHRWPRRDAEIAHRQQVAAIYRKLLPAEVQWDDPSSDASIYLRFPIRVPDRTALVAFLRKQGIHIGDTWYDAPIGPRKYLAKTNYQTGNCPHAEQLAEHIVNLPTHININESQAEQLAKKVAQWLSASNQ